MSVRTQGTLLDDRYRVVRHLGSGGMASVLLCRDERLGRQVAVKRLHADSPGEVEQRFVREAKLGASLNHPNLVSVFDTATDDEGVLIVMEYVEGEPLSRALKRGPLPPERVCAMIRDLGAALDHVHGQGVVHRDVKPGNVLLRHDGVTKLVDLGIATAADGTRITRSGTVLGTAAYMAPEQIEGREAGPAADIYAMAALAYESLSGKKAQPGRTPMEIVHRIATEPPPDLRKDWPEAPEVTAEVLRRGMAREPDERPVSAGALAADLSASLRDHGRTVATNRLRRGDGTAKGASAGAAAGAAASVPSARTETPTQTGARRRGPTGPRRAPQPVRPPADPRRPNRRPALIAAACLMLAAVGVLGALMLSGGDDPPPTNRAERQQDNPPAEGARKKDEREATGAQKREDKPAEKPAEDQPAADNTPAATAPPATGGGKDPERGAALNDQGFQLMRQGRYEEAVPILEQAVASFPAGTSNINYAYALFNLGKSLRLSGRPEEAIPILEKRLQIPDQTETVQAELDAARRDAGQG